VIFKKSNVDKIIFWRTEIIETDCFIRWTAL